MLWDLLSRLWGFFSSPISFSNIRSALEKIIFVFYQWSQSQHTRLFCKGNLTNFSLSLTFDLHPFQMLCGKCWHVAPWSRSPNTMLWWRAAPLMHIDRSSQMNKQHFYRYEQWTAMHDIPIEQTRWTRQYYSMKNWAQRGHNHANVKMYLDIWLT